MVPKLYFSLRNSEDEEEGKEEDESAGTKDSLSCSLGKKAEFSRDERRKKLDSPGLPSIPRVADKIRLLLVVDSDQDGSLVSKLVLARVLEGHGPGDSSVGRHEGITVFVGEEAGSEVKIMERKEVSSESSEVELRVGRAPSTHKEPTEPTPMTKPGAVEENTFP